MFTLIDQTGLHGFLTHDKDKKTHTKANSLLAGVINILRGEDSKEGNVRVCLMRKMEGKNKQ